MCGCARGVDSLGEDWAIKNNIPVKQFPADWEYFGKSAGIVRNKQMAEYAEAAIVVWDGKSMGSKNMIREMDERGKKSHIHIVGDSTQLDLDMFNKV